MDIQLPELGQPINQQDADKLYNRFFEIKERSFEKIQNALAGDADAIRYYCGRVGKDPVEEDLFYYFDKESLKDIITMINLGDADGMVIVHGARGLEEPVINGESAGRPTLMLFPFRNEESVDAKGEKSTSGIIHLLSAGREHPGTGGTQKPGKTLSGNPSVTPGEGTGIPGKVGKPGIHTLPDKVAI